MNLAAVYDRAAQAQGSPGRWQHLTPLQQEAIEVMAEHAATEPDPARVVEHGISYLVEMHGLQRDDVTAASYLPVAAALVREARTPACAWADSLPTVVPDPPVPGAYLLPADVYHRDPLRDHGRSVNASVLRRILPPSCPAMVRWDREHPPVRDCWDLGTVAHTLTLGVGGEIVEIEHKDWRTKEAKADREWAREKGAVALLSKDLQACREMAAAVHAHPLAGGILRVPGASEVALIWQEPIPGTDRTVWGRCMFDRHPDPSVVRVGVDLKTANADLSPEWCEKRVWDLGYYQAADWYARGYRAVHGVDLEAFWLLFVRSTPPHLVHVVQLDADLLARGRAANDEALQVWDRCVQSGVWPGPGRDDEPTLIGAPRWAR